VTPRLRGGCPRQEAPSPKTTTSSIFPARIELDIIAKYNLDVSTNAPIFSEPPPPPEEWAGLAEPTEADVRNGLRIIWRWANSSGLLTGELAAELANLAEAA
jgi:hypothetical protein